jgi:hypothetical protein
MFLTLVLPALLALARLVTAYPAYIPASQVPGAVRSPCPALNRSASMRLRAAVLSLKSERPSLANHGFLPRNGKNVSLVTLNAACVAGLNVGIDFCTAIGGLALLSKGAQAKGGLVFDLSDVDQHNFPIEHDGRVPRSVRFARADVSS